MLPSVSSDLSGTIGGPIQSAPKRSGDGTPRSPLSGTLDEPVYETLMRDLHAIGVKLKCVLVPKVGDEEETLKQLRDWDLWGPLIVCLTLSIMLSFTAPPEQGALVF